MTKNNDTSIKNEDEQQDLDALIRQMEIQKAQLELEVQFQKNMELFKQYAPVVYEEYINYEPTELQLIWDEGGYLNLVNSQTGMPVYNKNPVQFAEDQLTVYEKVPSWYRVSFTPSDDKIFQQTPYLQTINNRFVDEFKKAQPNINNPVSVLMVAGCGLGYHIPKLIELADPYTLCIFDPHKDSFYACLHTIDWEPIIKKLYAPGRLLKLFIGNTIEKTITSLRLLTHRIGLHNISNTYVFRHFNSAQTDEFLEQFKAQFHLTLTGTGFLEDEQISIAHTVENMNINRPVLNNTSITKGLPPVFIVGNGPSLDNLMDILREHQDKAIIISCGTTIGTLYKAGITPDFHVEMERTYNTTAALTRSAPEEYYKDINLLALNTVSPEALAMFKNAYIAIKANDPGDELINSNLPFQIMPLNASNPTCTNTGLTYALRFGFREIYLLGVDLGMKDKNKHHASSSQYYDDDNEVLNLSTQNTRMLTVPGNFSDEVETTQILDTSRANMSIAIDFYPDAKVYNLNDGARIDGTLPLHKKELQLTNSIDKDFTLNKILETCFTQINLAVPITLDSLKERYLKEALLILKNLSFSKEPKSKAEVLEELDKVFLTVYALQKSAPVSYWLLTGTLQNFFTLIMRACIVAKDTRELQENYRFSTNELLKFLKYCYKLINNECLVHHTEERYRDKN